MKPQHVTRVFVFVLGLIAVCNSLNNNVPQKHITITQDTTLSLTIRVHYPHGNFLSMPEFADKLVGGAIPTLFIRGDNLGLNWNKGQPLTYPSQDLWTISLTIPSSAFNQKLDFKILVSDNMWDLGANSQIVVPSSSGTVDVYPWFVYQKGVYQYNRNIFSPQLNNTRDLVVYTPPSYNENTLKVYNKVLLMHDGQNLFNASTSFIGIAWGCDVTVNQLVIDGAMDEIVIVGIDNTDDRTDELTYSYDPTEQAGGKGDLYLDFLEQVVVPFAKNNYRINVERENLGILGSSLGGLISCYAGWTRDTVYSTVGCMSSSFWWNSEDFDNVILVKYSPPTNPMTFYLDSGNAGDSNDDVTETITVKNSMLKLGYTLNETLFYYLDQGGQHNEYYWGKRFWIPMTELYAPSPLDVQQ